MTVAGALISAAATALLGLQSPAQADTSPPPAARAGTSPAASRADVRAACSTPEPGKAQCFALHRVDGGPALRGLTATTPQGYGAADLQDAYDLPTDGGAGRTIAIVDAYDDPNAEADLAVYRAQFGLPACTTDNGCFRKVSQRGGTDYPTPDADWASEISLDVDMVSAAAPLAHILLVEADTNAYGDLGQAVDQAVALGAKFVSNSYGGPEDPSEGQALDPYYNHPGVAVVASSGDDAYGTSYPAASPFVTSVGGTALNRDPDRPRGWSETVWESQGHGPGSGCSAYEPKPTYQTDSGCAGRTIADVSAVADPVTGVSVYATYGGSGWGVWGGTSAAAPLIAGVYAVAGTPVEGTYPSSYPYAASGAALNDVTSGSNGTCSPAYLCTAGPGYDGPTGLGTPQGLSAFRAGPHGAVSGKVTDSATGKPVAGAKVVVGTETRYAGTDGTYSLALPVGTYDLTASAFGYASAKVSGLKVVEGGALTQNAALTKVPTRTVSGKVTDGSGHGWPLYAKITVDGVPGGQLWTDPATGAYRVDLPQGATYDVNVAVAYPGYRPTTAAVRVGGSDVTRNIKVPVDLWAGTAPGYDYRARAEAQGFTGSAAPAGWTVENGDDTIGGWAFDDPGSLGNDTGGTGNFAVLDSDHYGPLAHQDSSLISPPFDLSDTDQPELTFRTTYKGSSMLADAEVSTDDGATWTSVWSAGVDVTGAKIDVPLTGYAHTADVRVKFHYVDSYGWYWKIDDVAVGDRYTAPTAGGLVVGGVSDANTGLPLVGATVRSADQGPAGVHTSTAGSDDPARRGDVFWSFAPAGKQQLTASYAKYTSSVRTVKVAADRVTSTSFPLTAGRLTVTSPLTASVGWGASTAKTMTVRNTGTAPATVKLGELAAVGATPSSSVPAVRIKGDYSTLASVPVSPSAGATTTTTTTTTTAAGAAATGTGSGWQAAPDLPVAVTGNAVDAYDGKVYSAFGFNGASDLDTAYRYDAATGAWSPIAPAADPREAPAHGFIGGKWYIAGGWIPGYPGGRTDSKLEIYDPATDTWSTGAAEPNPLAGSGSAVLDGKLYAVGGCTDHCGYTFTSVYDPTSDSWSQAAPYPQYVSWVSCGAIAGKLYCAGGSAGPQELKSAYVYDPATNAWSALPDMPMPLWGSEYAAASGQLVLSSGINAGYLTNAAYTFDPQTGAWASLPNVTVPSYRGGGAVGFYRVGGLGDGNVPSRSVSLLADYGYGDSTDVPWLAESRRQVTLRPGESTKVTVSFDAGVPAITRAGTYRAALHPTSDTPYTLADVPVSLTVARPLDQGGITGTVLGTTGHAGTAVPLAGATVTIDSRAARYTLWTDADGRFGLWLDARNSPVTVTVAKDGYRPATATVRVTKGKAVVSDFTLTKR